MSLPLFLIQTNALVWGRPKGVILFVIYDEYLFYCSTSNSDEFGETFVTPLSVKLLSATINGIS